MNRHGIMLWEI